MRRAGQTRGSALVGVLTLVLILLPLGAYVVLQCITDLRIGGNLASEVRAFYAAEAALQHAVAEVGPGASFDGALAGPDGIAGTADDGVFPFREGAGNAFTDAGFRYQVQAVRQSSALLQIVSTATAADGAAKTLAALVRRAATPFTPAAVYDAADLTRLRLGSAALAISGLDHGVDGTPTAAGGSVFGLSSADAAAEAVVRSRLASAPVPVTGTGDAPSVGTTAPLALTAYAAALEASPGSVRLTDVNPQSGTFGSHEVPQITWMDGGWDSSGAVSGCGVLIITGVWQVRGSFSFEGLVLALGGVVVDAGSELHLRGALWHGDSIDERFDLLGAGDILYSSAAVQALEALAPGVLPHAIELVGWQEEL